jgi:hypothetical protein
LACHITAPVESIDIAIPIVKSSQQWARQGACCWEFVRYQEQLGLSVKCHGISQFCC